MIGRLRGMLVAKHLPYLLVDVSGVGYELQASLTTFYRLPEIGCEVTLHTHFVVREDAQLLYGFFDVQEKTLFRTLIKVNGVGPKLALTILSSIEPDRFARCVQENDVDSLVRVPGIGKKTAERLIIEMRDRLEQSDNETGATLSSADSSTVPGKRSVMQDAVSALIGLGYKPQEASRAVALVEQPEGINSEQLIRLALKGMVK